MEWVLWIFHFSENVLCDHVGSSNDPDLHSASVYENDGYNSFRQRFCTRSVSFDIFWLLGCQNGHTYSTTERIIAQ